MELRKWLCAWFGFCVLRSATAAIVNVTVAPWHPSLISTAIQVTPVPIWVLESCDDVDLPANDTFTISNWSGNCSDLEPLVAVASNYSLGATLACDGGAYCAQETTSCQTRHRASINYAVCHTGAAPSSSQACLDRFSSLPFVNCQSHSGGYVCDTIDNAAVPAVALCHFVTPQSRGWCILQDVSLQTCTTTCSFQLQHRQCHLTLDQYDIVRAIHQFGIAEDMTLDMTIGQTMTCAARDADCMNRTLASMLDFWKAPFILAYSGDDKAKVLAAVSESLANYADGTDADHGSSERAVIVSLCILLAAVFIVAGCVLRRIRSELRMLSAQRDRQADLDSSRSGARTVTVQYGHGADLTRPHVVDRAASTENARLF